jgi:hypothetical protein
MVYTDVTAVMLHENTHSPNQNAVQQHVYTMHDAPLVDDKHHSGHGRVYSGTSVQYNTTTSNGEHTLLSVCCECCM